MSNDEPRPESIHPGMLFCERYRIERRLDDGGMATVYLAVDESSDQPVAIKVLFVRYSDNAVIRARFLDEGRIQAMLDHPNIVHVYRVIEEPILSFVMEYIDGTSLEDYLQQQEHLQEAEIIDLMMPVMSAIGFAHSKGIVHRDLKPSNILLQDNEGYLEPKVMDFGVAKISRGKELTAAGTTVGTLHYMSPEQIVGSSDIDGRADIYSLGCSLYKLATGEVPFNASSEFALMMAQVEAPPTPPSEVRPGLSSEMEQIILRALAKEPARRFQSIKEMTSALMGLGVDDDDGQDTDTITRPIPGELLQFAMEADEVARDHSQEYRLESQILTEAGDDAETLEELDVDVADQTHELSTDAIDKIERDRRAAARRHNKETAKLGAVATPEPDLPEHDSVETVEQDGIETTERDPLDERDSAETLKNDAIETTERDPLERHSIETVEQDAVETTERDPLERSDANPDATLEDELPTQHPPDTSPREIEELTTRPQVETGDEADDDTGLATTTERAPPEIDKSDDEQSRQSPGDETDAQEDDADATEQISRAEAEALLSYAEDQSDSEQEESLDETIELSKKFAQAAARNETIQFSDNDSQPAPQDQTVELSKDVLHQVQQQESCEEDEPENEHEDRKPQARSQKSRQQDGGEAFPEGEKTLVLDDEDDQEPDLPEFPPVGSEGEGSVGTQEITRRAERPSRPVDRSQQRSELPADRPPTPDSSTSTPGSSTSARRDDDSDNESTRFPPPPSAHERSGSRPRSATAAERPSEIPGLDEDSEPYVLEHTAADADDVFTMADDEDPRSNFHRQATESHKLRKSNSSGAIWLIGGLAALFIAAMILLGVLLLT